jgi:hypothetical protein
MDKKLDVSWELAAPIVVLEARAEREASKVCTG